MVACWLVLFHTVGGEGLVLPCEYMTTQRVVVDLERSTTEYHQTIWLELQGDILGWAYALQLESKMSCNDVKSESGTGTLLSSTILKTTPFQNCHTNCSLFFFHFFFLFFSPFFSFFFFLFFSFLAPLV